MADVQNILSSSPVQIAFYDSTNGTLYLGFISPSKCRIKQTPLSWKLISGMTRQYGYRTELQFDLLETDAAKLNELDTRRAYTQDVYITAFDYGLKIHDCYVTVAQNRNFENRKQDVITLFITTNDNANIELIKNLLSSVKTSYDYGNFNTDTNTDGLADGWVNTSYVYVTRTDPSFKNGASDYHQNFQSGAADQYAYCRMTWPFDQPCLITFSAYIQSSGSVCDSHLVIRTLDSGDSQIEIETGDTISAPITGINRYSLSMNAVGGDVDKIEVRIVSEESGTIKVDDAQLEFGSLTDYTEND